MNFQIICALVVGIAICIHLFRLRLLSIKTQPKNHEDFFGQLLQVGKSVVAYQKEDDSLTTNKQTIVCMPGWLEDHRYFSEIYTPKDAELIFINSCDYHGPSKDKTPVKVQWQINIPYPECTIEYDAAVLIMAVKNLASHKKVLLHGHCRGGAVVIEAVKQAPELFSQAQVILEAPILPEAPVGVQTPSKFINGPVGVQTPSKIINALVSKVIMYTFPFVAHALAKKGLPTSLLKNMGPLNSRKSHLLKGLFFSAKSAAVLMKNMDNMMDWPLQNKMSLLDNIKGGHILLGSSDSVLSRRLMIRSIHKNKGNLNIVNTKHSSHFISLDIPEQVSTLNFS